jgi:hypothetical protein
MSPWTLRSLAAPENASLIEIVSELYRSLQRAREGASSQRAAQYRRYEALARHVAELYVELFRFERELGPSLDGANRRRLLRILELWQGTDVCVTSPEGQPLTDELTEKVDVLGSTIRPDIPVPTIERVDQPIVEVGGFVFKGKVRVALPQPGSPNGDNDGQEHSD